MTNDPLRAATGPLGPLDAAGEGGGKAEEEAKGANGLLLLFPPLVGGASAAVDGDDDAPRGAPRDGGRLGEIGA